MFGGGVNILFVGNAAIPYDPTTTRGTWTNATLATPIKTKLCIVPTGASALKSWTEHVSNVGSAHSDRLGRFCSAALLSPVTISGSIDFCIGSWVDDLNNNLRMSIFVTTGATDALRGMLLTDYTWMASRNR